MKKSAILTLLVLVILVAAGIILGRSMGDNDDAAAGNAANSAAGLALSPSSGSHGVGDEFTVDVMLDTGGEKIDGVDLRYLRYDADRLELVDADADTPGKQIKAGDLMPVTVDNSADAKSGTISFSQVVSGGTSYANEGPETLATLTFRAKEAGTAKVVIDHEPGRSNDSNVAAAGKDILGGAKGARFEIE